MRRALVRKTLHTGPSHSVFKALFARTTRNQPERTSIKQYAYLAWLSINLMLSQLSNRHLWREPAPDLAVVRAESGRCELGEENWLSIQMDLWKVYIVPKYIYPWSNCESKSNVSSTSFHRTWAKTRQIAPCLRVVRNTQCSGDRLDIEKPFKAVTSVFLRSGASTLLVHVPGTLQGAGCLS